MASFVQGLLKIGSRCRVYEIKHACYGGTAGIVHSIDWIARNHSLPKKALVIMTDIALYGFGSPGEPTQGAGAVALLVERDPLLCSIDTSLTSNTKPWRPRPETSFLRTGSFSILSRRAIRSQFLLIRWLTIFSRPSKVISNMGKISRMMLMVLV